ncbi:MAG: DUF3516 domain-containing protein [Ilumatobacteraceae bacterium]
MPYEERMDRLGAVSWPKPLGELLDTCFAEYRGHHPWVAESPSPKSIVREMLEAGDVFATFVRRYRLDRSEGLVLRYLTDAWRTLDRSLPDGAYTDELEDVVDWLGARPRHRRHPARRVDPPRRWAGARTPRRGDTVGACRPRRRGVQRCGRPRSAGQTCSPAASTACWPIAPGGRSTA